ncbi:MAG: extracellular solute-binding protein [Streptosporangiaceae bacterium]
MTAIATRRGARTAAVLALTCIGIAAAGCGSSSSSPSGSSSQPSGTANVAYASSLDYLNSKVAGPAFTTAEGYKYSGTAGAAGQLSSEIAAKVISPNVFQSVGGDNITPLEPKFTKWYISYAGNKIVVAYNPHSTYAPEFEAIASGKKPLKDLFTLLQTPGLKLGRTDPNIDPQGRYFIEMLELAQMHYHLPADTVTKIVGSPIASSTSSQIYAESALDSTLQSGQLDAASAYYTQAVELHLHYIALPAAINLGDAALADQYAKAAITTSSGGSKSVHMGAPLVLCITIIGKPTSAATAFVRYTLSPAGVAQYKQGGFTILTPTLYGPKSAVPAAIASELGG